MPEWIHERAEHLLAKNPSMPKAMAFAVATQQSHALGKSPKGYGTPEGKAVAKQKFDTPKDDQKKANPGKLESPKMEKKAHSMFAAFADELEQIEKSGGMLDAIRGARGGLARLAQGGSFVNGGGPASAEFKAFQAGKAAPQAAAAVPKAIPARSAPAQATAQMAPSPRNISAAMPASNGFSDPEMSRKYEQFQNAQRSQQQAAATGMPGQIQGQSALYGNKTPGVGGFPQRPQAAPGQPQMQAAQMPTASPQQSGVRPRVMPPAAAPRVAA